MLDELPFGPGRNYRIEVNDHFESSLTKALKLYSSARIEALNHLYLSEEITEMGSGDVAADKEEVAASCGHFSYNLEDFAKEMFVFLHILKQLEALQDHPNRTWDWMKFWRSWSKA